MNKSKQIKSTYYIYCTKQYLVPGRTKKNKTQRHFFRCPAEATQVLFTIDLNTTATSHKN